jgi:hypothetical protein
VGIGRAGFRSSNVFIVAVHNFDFGAGRVAKAASGSKGGRQIKVAV